MDSSLSFILQNVGVTTLIIIISILLVWSYYYDPTRNLFIVIISLIYMIYCIINIVYTFMYQDTVNKNSFNTIIGSSIYILIITVIIFISFLFRYIGIV